MERFIDLMIYIGCRLHGRHGRVDIDDHSSQCWPYRSICGVDGLLQVHVDMTRRMDILIKASPKLKTTTDCL